MSTSALPSMELADGLDLATLEEMVRRHFRASLREAVVIREVTRHSNLNFVFTATVGGRRIYLKVVPERPKKLPMALPRRRVFAEAESMQIFANAAGGAVEVPETLFVDRRHYVLGLSDVGRRRRVLLDTLPADYSLLIAAAEPLGAALGRVHSSTRGLESFRPPEEEALLRKIIFGGLIGAGAQAAFPDLAGPVLQEMAGRCECLVHADLWGKNILVGEGVRPAIVDFEGAFVGDPAFDVATLLAVGLLPALEDLDYGEQSRAFVARFLASYRKNALRSGQPDAVFARAFRFSGCMLAARAFGPFAYPLSDECRRRVGEWAKDLTKAPPQTIEDFLVRIQDFMAVEQS